MSGPWAKVSSPDSSKATSLRDVMNEQGMLNLRSRVLHLRHSETD